MNKVQELIKQLDLSKHPEGGYYKQIYRSEEIIAKEHLPERFKGSRSISTAIYFLLTSDNFSAFHRIKQDEGWHFYDGAPLTIHMISPSGKYSKITLGRNLKEGQVPMYIVPAGYYFGASIIGKDNYSFVGCTVAPGFDFDDFELPSRASLIDIFPQHEEIITELTHK